MHMHLFIIIWLVSVSLSTAHRHNSCFNDSSNLSAPADEYALISFVSISKEIPWEKDELYWEFNQVEAVGIPSTNHLHSATLQGEERMWFEYLNSVRANIYRYPIVAWLFGVGKSTLISLSSDFKSIQTCPMNGFLKKYFNQSDTINLLTNRGVTACTRTSLEKMNCTLYGLYDPESSECVEKEFSLSIQDSYEDINIMFDKRNQSCYSGFRKQDSDSKYLFITCQDETGHMIEKKLSVEAIRRKESPFHERLMLVGTESELYYLAYYDNLYNVQLSKIVMRLAENEIQIHLEHQIAQVHLNHHVTSGILEGPTDTNKLVIALFDDYDNIYRMMSPWDRTFAYNIRWHPIHTSKFATQVLRKPVKLVPICAQNHTNRSNPLAQNHTNKSNPLAPLLLIACLVIVILSVLIGLRVRVVLRRRSNGDTLDHSKIANKKQGSVNKTWAMMFKEVLGLVPPSCLVVREIEKQTKPDQAGRGELISDGSTINMVDTNKVFKDRYQGAEERRMNRLHHSKVGTISNLKKSKSNNLALSDVITITRRSDQFTKRSMSVN